METQLTLTCLIGGVALAIAASFGDHRRRRDPLAWHAHLPWHAVIFGGACVALFAAIHLLTLARAAT